MAIFMFNEKKKKWLEVDKVPVKVDFDEIQINMRNTWSGQTKVEFSQTTIDEDIAQRNRRE